VPFACLRSLRRDADAMLCSMTFPFGRRTVATLVEAISDGMSHSDMTTMFMRVGVDEYDNRGKSINKATRAQTVLRHLMLQDDGEDADRAAREIATEILNRAHGWGVRPTWLGPLETGLAADGLVFDPEIEQLLPESDGVDIATERSILAQQLDGLGWTTAGEHYRQAVEGVASGNWEAANSQLRSFLEQKPRAPSRHLLTYQSTLHADQNPIIAGVLAFLSLFAAFPWRRHVSILRVL
jgi:hypothetical protein